jgi:polyhydroxyalkanoate synthesis repressor PhaR
MADKRIIKRYTNRKLYDKQESRYVTLEEIARLVRRGEDVKVVDNETEDDLTAVTLAQIILEEEKNKTHLLSVPFLRKLIRTGEARMQDLSDRATRSFEAIGDLTEQVGERVREVVGSPGRALGGGLSFLDELFELPQRRLARLRETARESIDKLRSNPTVRRELERIAHSLETLEEAISRIGETDEAHTEVRPGTRNEDDIDLERTNGASSSRDESDDADAEGEAGTPGRRHGAAGRGGSSGGSGH